MAKVTLIQKLKIAELFAAGKRIEDIALAVGVAPNTARRYSLDPSIIDARVNPRQEGFDGYECIRCGSKKTIRGGWTYKGQPLVKCNCCGYRMKLQAGELQSREEYQSKKLTSEQARNPGARRELNDRHPCKHCQSLNTWKSGFSDGGRQRWKCKDCYRNTTELRPGETEYNKRRQPIVIEEDKEDTSRLDPKKYTCPYCHNKGSVKYGKDANFQQKYKCRFCHSCFRLDEEGNPEKILKMRITQHEYQRDIALQTFSQSAVQRHKFDTPIVRPSYNPDWRIR